MNNYIHHEPHLINVHVYICNELLTPMLFLQTFSVNSYNSVKYRKTQFERKAALPFKRDNSMLSRGTSSKMLMRYTRCNKACKYCKIHVIRSFMCRHLWKYSDKFPTSFFVVDIYRVGMQRLLWEKSAPKQPKQTMMMAVAEKEEKAGKAKRERRREERRRRNKQWCILGENPSRWLW